MIDYSELLDYLDKAICCLEYQEVKDNPFIRILYQSLVSLYDYVNDGLNHGC